MCIGKRLQETQKNVNFGLCKKWVGIVNTWFKRYATVEYNYIYI